MCLGNISEYFSVNNVEITGLNGYVYDFSVDYKTLDTKNIINIHKYLMKKYDIKYCLGQLKKCLLDYQRGLVNTSNNTK